jgi:gliding motility-associated-like protein
MKKLMLPVSFVWFVCPSFAQNLVINPSFEEYTECPSSVHLIGDHNAITLVEGWSTPTVSTDYYHICGDNVSGVPSNLTGFQYPKAGEAYVGINMGGPMTIPGNVTEYLQGQLVSPLIKDSSYLVEIFVNLADTYRIAIDEFGIFFTDTFFYKPEYVVGYNTSTIIPLVPHLRNEPGNMLNDKEDWMPLRWVYRAKGAERFFTMGLFRYWDEINWVLLPGVGGWMSIYLFIDDVRIEPLPYQFGQLGLRDTVLCAQPFAVELAASGLHQGYRWSTGDTTASITVTEPGVYALEAYYGEFLVRDTARVRYLPPEAVSLGGDRALCPGELPYVLEAPAGLDAYRWSTGDTTASIAVAEPGLYWVEAEYTCGTVRDTTRITAEAPGPFSLGPDTLLCGPEGSELPLSAGAGYESYAWSTGDTAQAIAAAAPGLYWAEGHHRCGAWRDSIRLSWHPLLSLGLPPDTLLCPGALLRLEAAPGFDSYRWGTGAAGAAIAIAAPGVYALEAAYPCGQERAEVEVRLAPELRLELPPRLEAALGQAVELRPSLSGAGPFRYAWSPAGGLSCTDCAAPLAQLAGSQAYRLAVSDAHGCQAEAEVEVAVQPRLRLYVPNAFSPNADGANDRLRPYAGPEVKAIRRFELYGRWGGLAYQAENLAPGAPGTGWDGTIGGQPAPAGLYLWRAEAERLDGVVVWLRGEVLLLR